MINRRFAPKTKELIFFREGSKSTQKQKSPKLFTCESFSKENFVTMDHQSTKKYQFKSGRENILNECKFAKPLQSQNKNKTINSQRSPILSARKQKLQNLRSSIQSLQKIIEKSREMLNESSVLNSSKNTLFSQKKIKSDSLDIKFNYSTKKMNISQLSQIKANKLLNQSLQKSNLQFFIDDSTIQSYRENLLLESTRKNQSIIHQKEFSSNFKSKDIQNTTQIKTNHQLNMTLEKLLNQSFQSTINGKTLSISVDSPSSTFAGQTPKWFKSNDIKKSQKFQQKNKTFNLQNESFSNQMNSVDASQLSQYQKIINNQNQSPDQNFKKRNTKNISKVSPFLHNKNVHQKTFDQSSWNDIGTKQNIFIEDQDQKLENQIYDDIIEDEQSSGVKEIQNFFTNSRQSYHGEMRLQNSYLRNIKNLQEFSIKETNQNEKPKRLALRTPRAYKNYQQNNSSRKNSNSKSWIPKNFNQFENKVLQGKIYQNIFKQQTNQGKFSPRILNKGKQNQKQTSISERKQKIHNPQDKDKKKKFINDVWKYPFVQRYLKQSDIFLIYERLRRSKVPQNKWILFVIDEVHKKMKQSH